MVREKRQESLEQRVLHFVQEHHLVLGQHKLLVAVSGGADSVCLLHILVKLQEELDIKLHVAHLYHQLRGTEAEADAQYVSNLAYQLVIPVTIEQRDVKVYRAQQHLSLEAAAREVRYTFLAQVARSIGTSQVAVGHTVDDHIETILLHLIRGTGTRGLRGLQPSTVWQSVKNKDSLNILRPLLQVSRRETADYCHNHNLMPRIDASNLSLSPLRNRIRHQLLPLLQSYNPRVAEALLRTARIAEDELAFLDREVSKIWDSIAQRQENTITLDKERFLELPPALQRHLLRTSVEKLVGLKDIETRHIEEIMTALTKPAGKRLSLPEGLIFSIEYNKYLIGPDPAALSPFPILEGELPLKLPGKTLLSGWRISANIISREQIADKGKPEGALAPSETTTPLFPLAAYFDFDKTDDKLVVRTRQPGDRFQPLGMSQPKKLGEFMIDAKIPHSWRQRIPIVCSPEQILWVVGWRIDERVKVADTTQKVLCLEFKWR